MTRSLGVTAAVFGWLGWLTLSPAFGFPSLATAAMFNRLFVPAEDPGFWLGWVVLFIGLIVAAAAYLAAVDRGLVRSGIASGVVYGAVCWLFVGAVIMSLLGLAVPAPAPPAPGVPSPPDPMRGSFMMLHLGIAAPLTALIGWLGFGAVVGSSAGSRATDPSTRRLVPSWSGEPRLPAALPSAVVASAIAVFAIAAVGRVADRVALPWAGAPQSATPASAMIDALPEGPIFVSIVELPQAAGAVLGPHAHLPGFAWGLDGVATLTFHDGTTLPVGSGEAGFMAAQAVHAHVNADNRLPAAGLALAIVALAGLASLLATRLGAAGGWRFWGVLLLLITAGVVATWNPWSNDWLFVSVRPETTRGAPMPLPSAARVYESPNLGQLPVGPYQETIEEITVAPNGQAQDLRSAGAAVLLVLDGRVEVRSADGSAVTIATRGATLLQSVTEVVVSNPTDRPARLLRFAVTPAASGN